MRRREFFSALMVTALPPIAALAQSTGSRRRVAVLAPGSEVPKSLRQALGDRGYGEQNITIDVAAADWDLRRLPMLADELVRRSPDVIVAASPTAVAAARKATSTIPIVMTNVADPIDAGFVANLAHPGGNITGLANLAQDTAGKRLELLKTAAPHIRRLAVLFDPVNPGNINQLHAVQQAAPTLGLEPFPVEAIARDAVGEAFAAIERSHADGLFVADDPVVSSQPRRIAEAVLRLKLPAVFQSRAFVDAGGLISYGSDTEAIYRRAAYYVDRILEGAKPADLPVEQPTKFDLAINLKTAKALGLSVPPLLLAQADEVIE